jgi:hypothetical protein
MKRSTPLIVVVGAITAIAVLLIMVVVGGYWWSNVGPLRPTSVPRTAVFLRAPATGAPGPPRGEWLACWESSGANRCRLTTRDGTTKYEAVFVPYGRTGPVPADQLMIDATKTAKSKYADGDGFWTTSALVPLVYLKDGEVLIPAEYYDKGSLILDQKRSKEQ